MNQIRKEAIKNYIKEHGKATVKEICDLCPGVSTMTIYRDMERLEEEGELIRVRGGAIAATHERASESKIETRMKRNLDEKRQMAKKAMALIQPDSTIILDAGTSNLALANTMPDMRINIFTTAPNIAVELSKLTNPTIHMCGGTLNRSNQAVSGSSTLEMLGSINFEYAFIGVSGFTAEGGFSCGMEEEMQVKRLLIKKAKKTIVLMDSSKIGKIFPYKFGDLEDIDFVIGDEKLPEEFISLAKEAGVEVL